MDGGYGGGRWIRQALCNPPSFDGNHVIVGSWVVGDEAAGMSLREDTSLITRNTSRFLPHFIRD
ncbi:putative acid--amine ligase YjfC [compost metagenome]